MVVDLILTQGLPAITAAVGAYGAAVLTKVEDEAANETVKLGQRLLRKLLRRDTGERVRSAVTELAGAAPDEKQDAEAALRQAVRALLKQDPELRAELTGMLPASSGATASGERAVAIGGDNSGIVSTGDGAFNIQST